MGKVFSVRHITLRPGVSAAEFEQFLSSLPDASNPPGMKQYVCKAYRGREKGQYVIISEFDSLERLTELFPTTKPDDASPEMKRSIEAQREGYEKALAFMEPLDDNFTDYVVLR